MNNSNQYILAIDLGGSFTKLALFKDEQIVEQKIFTSPQSADDFIDLIHLETKALGKDIKYISVAAAGFWDEAKILRQSFYLKDYIGKNIWQEIENKLSTPIILGTDVELAVLGEALYGQNDQYESLLHINFGTGFSAGLFKDGKVFSNSHSPSLRLDFLIQPQRAFIKDQADDLVEIEYLNTDLITCNIVNLAFILSPKKITIGGGKVKDKWQEIFAPCVKQAMDYLDANLCYKIEIEQAKLDYPSLWGAYAKVSRHCEPKGRSNPIQL